jgi:hypothetical protein
MTNETVMNALTRKQFEKWCRSLEIAHLYQEGMTLAAIGEKYGITRQAVQLILIKRGIPRRSTGRHAPETAFPQEQQEA